jgi:hemerythrin-like domain-containing protein
MLLGGIAAGFVASKVVPPLIAASKASSRVRAGGDPFQLLIEDHRQILACLDRMAGTPPDSKVRRAGLFLMLKRKLAKHAMAEEDVVYPILHGRSGEADRGKHLYEEHADMKIALFEMERKIKAGEDWTENVASLRELIRRHADEEETHVFPQLRRQMEEDRLPKISAEISREEAMVV